MIHLIASNVHNYNHSHGSTSDQGSDSDSFDYGCIVLQICAKRIDYFQGPYHSRAGRILLLQIAKQKG